MIVAVVCNEMTLEEICKLKLKSQVELTWSSIGRLQVAMEAGFVVVVFVASRMICCVCWLHFVVEPENIFAMSSFEEAGQESCKMFESIRFDMANKNIQLTKNHCIAC